MKGIFPFKEVLFYILLILLICLLLHTCGCSGSGRGFLKDDGEFEFEMDFGFSEKSIPKIVQKIVPKIIEKVKKVGLGSPWVELMEIAITILFGYGSISEIRKRKERKQKKQAQEGMEIMMKSIDEAKIETNEKTEKIVSNLIERIKDESEEKGLREFLDKVYRSKIRGRG